VFEYYSAKVDLVSVDSVAQKVGPKEIDRRFMDLDLCRSCWDGIMERVRRVIGESGDGR